MLPRLTLQRALVGAVAVAVVAGLIPSAIALDRRLAGTLDARARADLALAPRVFMDRQAMSSDAMMMHARDFAHISGLADALASGDRAAARRVADRATDPADGTPIIVGPSGEAWEVAAGDTAILALAARTRTGASPSATVSDGHGIRSISFAPVLRNNHWIGAAGFVRDFDMQQARLLTGLTRSDVVAIAKSPLQARAFAVATTLDSATTRAVLSAARQWSIGAETGADHRTAVHDVRVGRHHFIASAAPLSGAGTVVFVRNLDSELAVLPMLRRLALLSGFSAVLLALVVGSALAALLARPVHQLAGAADALALGEFDAPLPRSSVREVARLGNAFAAMRSALAARIAQLGESNALLADRNEQLTVLQADLVQRERLAATGRLVAQLAHEIRNPIASVRNLLELIRRRLSTDTEGREFADLAIDELLRMHELAEQMLDVHRPRAAEPACSRPAVVAADVTALLTAGAIGTTAPVVCEIADARAHSAEAPLAPGALKQVLHNLVQNAREAVASSASPDEKPIVIRVATEDTRIIVTVADSGPGIPASVLPRVFDAFFTTKASMRGVGLGLFIAEGIVRNAGGTLTAASSTPTKPVGHGGTVIRIELPMVNTTPKSRESAL